MDKKDIFFSGIITGMIIIGVVLSIISCQPPEDPLKNAEFDCVVIKKGFAYRIWIQCKDSLYPFADELYSGAFKEKDTIYEPLNK